MSYYYLFLLVFTFFLVDGKMGYSAGGSDRGLQIGARSYPGECGWVGSWEVSSLLGEGYVSLLVVHLSWRS